jgi:hypothetical protein
MVVMFDTGSSYMYIYDDYQYYKKDGSQVKDVMVVGNVELKQPSNAVIHLLANRAHKGSH